jgi:hypothetical protein
VRQAWGFVAGTNGRFSLRLVNSLRSLGLGRFTLQVFYRPFQSFSPGVSVCIRKVSISFACCFGGGAVKTLTRTPTAPRNRCYRLDRIVSGSSCWRTARFAPIWSRSRVEAPRHTLDTLLASYSATAPEDAHFGRSALQNCGHQQGEAVRAPSRLSIGEAPYESHFRPRRKLPLPFKRLAGLVIDRQQRVHQ